MDELERLRAENRALRAEAKVARLEGRIEELEKQLAAERLRQVEMVPAYFYPTWPLQLVPNPGQPFEITCTMGSEHSTVGRTERIAEGPLGWLQNTICNA